LTVNAAGLTAGSNYTIHYSFAVKCGSSSTTFSGDINFKATGSTATENASGTFGTSGLTGANCNVTGSATLTSSGSTVTITINGAASAQLNCHVACNTSVYNSGSMEGNLPIRPGDTVKCGFDFTIPGSHPSDTVGISNASCTLPVQCPSGTSNLVITIPNQSITDNDGNGSQWFPSGDKNSPLVYQGSIKVPSSFCGGATGHAPQGATFTANLTATTTNRINFRFHYSDNTSGSWSSTQSYCR
jgi:hypothetical protein